MEQPHPISEFSRLLLRNDSLLSKAKQPNSLAITMVEPVLASRDKLRGMVYVETRRIQYQLFDGLSNQ